jgi:hypothetical protein
VGDRSRGRYATPADFHLHDGAPYRRQHVRRWGLGFVHRSRAILCRAVPNRSVTIRNCCIAVTHLLLLQRGRERVRRRHVRLQAPAARTERNGTPPAPAASVQVSRAARAHLTARGSLHLPPPPPLLRLSAARPSVACYDSCLYHSCLYHSCLYSLQASRSSSSQSSRWRVVHIRPDAGDCLPLPLPLFM